jgi:hypothetical protein
MPEDNAIHADRICISEIGNCDSKRPRSLNLMMHARRVVRNTSSFTINLRECNTDPNLRSLLLSTTYSHATRCTTPPSSSGAKVTKRLPYGITIRLFGNCSRYQTLCLIVQPSAQEAMIHRRIDGNLNAVR